MDMCEKYGNLVLLMIFPLKTVDCRLVITYFGTPQIAPDHTIFVKNFPGEHAPDPPSNIVTTQCYQVTYTPAMLLSVKVISLFRIGGGGGGGGEGESLSDIYLLHLTEVK